MLNRNEQDRIRELVAAVAAIFVQNPQAGDSDVVVAAVGAGIDAVEAELAVAFLPSAFARALMREQNWDADLPDAFQVKDRRNRWVRFRLSDSTIYRAAAELAEHQRVSHRAAFAAVAGRSAELNAIDKALTAGSDVRAGVFSPMALLRVPAEAISQRKPRWWNRLRELAVDGR